MLRQTSSCAQPYLLPVHSAMWLQLYGNPLEYLPELAPAVGLRSLSLANVRIMADAAYSRWVCGGCVLGGRQGLPLNRRLEGLLLVLLIYPACIGRRPAAWWCCKQLVLLIVNRCGFCELWLVGGLNLLHA